MKINIVSIRSYVCAAYHRLHAIYHRPMAWSKASQTMGRGPKWGRKM